MFWFLRLIAFFWTTDIFHRPDSISAHLCFTRDSERESENVCQCDWRLCEFLFLLSQKAFFFFFFDRLFLHLRGFLPLSASPALPYRSSSNFHECRWHFPQFLAQAAFPPILVTVFGVFSGMGRAGRKVRRGVRRCRCRERLRSCWIKNLLQR